MDTVQGKDGSMEKLLKLSGWVSFRLVRVLRDHD